MKSTLVAGITIIVFGVVGLVYGSFVDAPTAPQARFGTISVTLAEQRTVNVPHWLGGAAVALGLVLILSREKA